MTLTGVSASLNILSCLATVGQHLIYTIQQCQGFDNPGLCLLGNKKQLRTQRIREVYPLKKCSFLLFSFTNIVF